MAHLSNCIQPAEESLKGLNSSRIMVRKSFSLERGLQCKMLSAIRRYCVFILHKSRKIMRPVFWKKNKGKEMHLPHPSDELEKLLQRVAAVRCNELIKIGKTKRKHGRNWSFLAPKNKREIIKTRRVEMLATGSNVHSWNCLSVPWHQWTHLTARVVLFILISTSVVFLLF